MRRRNDEDGSENRTPPPSLDVGRMPEKNDQGFRAHRVTFVLFASHEFVHPRMQAFLAYF